MESAEEIIKCRALAKAQDRTAQRLRAELQAAQNTSADLRAQLAVARRNFALSDALPPKPFGEMESLRTALTDARNRIADMEQSWSWRITGPVRALGRSFLKG